MTSDSTSALQGRWEVLIVLKDLKEGMELSVLLVVGGGWWVVEQWGPVIQQREQLAAWLVIITLGVYGKLKPKRRKSEMVRAR